MFSARPGDFILRGSFDTGFQLVDANTNESMTALLAMDDIIELARQLKIGTIWQQNVDERGRPMGEPFRLLSTK